jgi:ParB-like chromosome segregation protein Spo0J
MSKLKVHPAAEIFPMMTEDELNELAQDIKVNGQRFPIVRDKEGLLVDGRNRLEACSRAGVEPKFDTLNGEDPVAFILSANIARRHLNKGQQAMAVAKIYPEATEKGGRGKTSVFNTDVSKEYITKARAVLRYAPDLAESVLSGSVALNDAYQQAQDRKRASESTESRLETLRKEASDLADLVVEEKMKLGEAEAARKERKENAERHLRVGIQNLKSVLLYLTSQSVRPKEMAEEYPEEVLREFDLKELKYATETLSIITQNKERMVKK